MSKEKTYWIIELFVRGEEDDYNSITLIGIYTSFKTSWEKALDWVGERKIIEIVKREDFAMIKFEMYNDAESWLEIKEFTNF